MRQFSRVVARNSAFGMAAQMAIKLLSFGFSVLIVRNLGAADYGQYAAVLAFGAMFVFLADLGLSPYTVREVARWRDAPDGMERVSALFGDVLLLRFLLSVLAALLLITTAWLTGRPMVMTIAIALGTLGLVMYSVQGSSDAMLAGFERLDLSAGSKVSYQLVFVLAGAAALLLGAGYYGLIGANLLGIAVMTIICWRGARALGLRPGRAVVRNWPVLLRASIPFGIIGFTLGLSYRFDSVLLNIFRSDVETGYYNAAYNLVFSTVMLSNVINTSLYPSLTRQAASAPHTLPAIYERALRYLLALALPIAVGAATLADQIVPFLFKAAYLPAVPALQIVIWVVPLMFASEFLGYVVLIAGDERRAARAVVVRTGFNVVLNLLVVPRYGFLGAAAMTVLTEAVLVGQ
jgi:O-antigen/teichoic acid export membrane protein